MSTIYMSQLSTLPLMEGDQDQGLFPAFHIAKDPPILFPFMINSPVDQHQGQSYGDQHLRQQVLAESHQLFKDRMMMRAPDLFPTPSPFRRPTIQSIGSDMIQRSAYDPYDIENKRADGSTSSWAVAQPAKMKIMRKATSEYPEGGAARKPRRRAQAHQDESRQLQQQAVGVIRVCSDCNTTKTPLWRSGPCGPKSLCNACGIRQRKARRAMAAAAAAGNGGAAGVAFAAAQAKLAKNEKRADVDRSLPFKKRCKMAVVDHAAAAAKETPAVAAPTKEQGHGAVDNVAAAATTSLQSKGATPPPSMSFHAFPADEITDAAMLLMTLSCGLVRS
ncbi:protein CYTOKININ-RESPONSIVE GATA TRANSCRIPTION FACTOR 1-like [Phragmites australis]|uniref:protein CYTOKININ-RESPONSIVE GATA TRANSCRIPTION FACTOR 1-like n=1 Tax=Phragmites australis TaxID=29695 RepID=UPI002D769D6C|nr:protein CYTOKININ-RESPONSIVE GATA TRANSCRIPTION FACTOR 1-like [Phragmites australis]